MKNSLIRLTAAAGLGLTALTSAWSEPARNPYAVLLPPSKAVVSIKVTPPPPPFNPVPLATVTAPTPTTYAQWVDLKDYTFAQRDTLLAGLTGMLARVDSQIGELNAKRAAMIATSTHTADWDFAMKEMYNARAMLKFACDELGKASSETWSQQRDRVGQAWDRAQNAYAQVKSSTTM